MRTSASESKSRNTHRISIELNDEDYEMIEKLYGNGNRTANITHALLNPFTVKGTVTDQNKARLLERVLDAINGIGNRIASADITDEAALEILCELRSLRKELLES